MQSNRFFPPLDGSVVAETRVSARLGRFSEVCVLFASLSSQIRIRDPNQGGRDVTEEILAGGSGSRNSTPPVGCSSSTPTPPQVPPAPSRCNLDTRFSILRRLFPGRWLGFTAAARCVYLGPSSFRIRSLSMSFQSRVDSYVVASLQLQAWTVFLLALWVLLG